MSYNITGVSKIVIDAKIRETDRFALLDQCRDYLPESCFLKEVKGSNPALGPVDSEGYRAILRFAWQGEGSRTAFEESLPAVADKIVGVVEVVLIWEHGDSVSGLRVKNGRLSEPAVLYVLAEE